MSVAMGPLTGTREKLGLGRGCIGGSVGARAEDATLEFNRNLEIRAYIHWAIDTDTCEIHGCRHLQRERKYSGFLKLTE